MIPIDDLIVGLIFIWIFYDTYKSNGLVNASVLIISIIGISVIIVAIPILFGVHGKIIMYSIFGLIGVVMYIRKRGWMD